jgi:type II secretory pathway pseudopilin PulG
MDLEVRPARPARSGEAGFSLIEALVAAAILLLIAIGLIPLFTRSILNNAAGSDHTMASTLAKDDLEAAMDIDFNSPEMVLTGANVELLTTEFLLPGTTQYGDEQWVPTVTSAQRPSWTRTDRVQQFSIASLDDGRLLDTERRSGSTQLIEVHFKVVEVQIDSRKRVESGLPPGPRLVYRIIKPF